MMLQNNLGADQKIIIIIIWGSFVHRCSCRRFLKFDVPTFDLELNSIEDKRLKLFPLIKQKVA